MKTNMTIYTAKLFGLKEFGKGCRFGVKVNSRKQDGTYTQGTFLNCKHNEMLNPDCFYTLDGFLGDNEYNGNNSLEFIVMNASPEELPHPKGKNTGVNAPVHREPRPTPYNKPSPVGMPENNLPEIDINEESIPF
jgi:hypothetical protein